MVKWTDSELDTLADKVATFRFDNIGASLIQLVNKAQESFPEDRRRKLQSCPDNLLEKIILRVEAIRKPKVQIADPPELTLIELSTQLVQRILDSLDQKHKEVITMLRIVKPMEKEIVPVSKNGHRKRVTIYGLLNNQMHAVQKEIGESLDLRFVGQDVRNPTLGPSDQFVLMTQFASHEMDRKASAYYGDRLYRHRGGVSTLIEHLKGIV